MESVARNPDQTGSEQPSLGRWESLADERSEEVGRRMGWLGERFHRAIAAGRCPPSWGLDRKVFRRLLAAVLPPGHSLPEIRDELREAERNLLAARAHERIQSATTWVPNLPPEVAEGRYLVWASPVLRPRGLMVRSWVSALNVTREEIPNAVCELWSRPFLERSLSELPPEARRAELAIGITALASTTMPASVYALLPEVFEAPARGFPYPTFARTKVDAPPLLRGALDSVFDSTVRAFSVVSHQKEVEGLLKSGELSLSPEEVARLIGTVRGEFERSVAEEILGRPRDQLHAGRLSLSPFDWPRTAQVALGRALSGPELTKRVERITEAVEERSRSLRELDLVVLPDDALKTTLEQQNRLFESCAALAAECHVTARFLCHAYSSLSGVPLALVDAGLTVPLLNPLLAFEEAMVIVRREAELHPERPSFSRGSGGERALLDVRARYPEFFGLSATGEVPKALEYAAEKALSGGVDIVQRCREAKVRFDRAVLEREASKPRFLASALSPLRAAAREFMVLTESARLAEVRASHFLLMTFSEADRRLHRLEPGLGERPALQLSLPELIEALDMRGTSLRARAGWRRSESLQAWEGEQLGIAALRLLPRVFELPYGGAVEYSGRASDSVPVTARAIDSTLNYKEIS